MRQDSAAGEDVGLALAHFHLLPSPSDRIDIHDARASPGRVADRGARSLGEREQQQRADHWFGSVNLPPVPLGRMAVTTLKSGSDVNPSPAMWRFGSSNTNGLSELTWFLTWL